MKKYTFDVPVYVTFEIVTETDEDALYLALKRLQELPNGPNLPFSYSFTNVGLKHVWSKQEIKE